MALTRRLGQFAYGALFTMLFPALLAVWAWRLDHAALRLYPLPLAPWLGAALASVGLLLMAASMCALWYKGNGLPMNAFPPTRLVASATYALLSHPIYVGFVLAVGGIAICMHSAAGFWIVTPVAALAAVALVVGYEGPQIRTRFPDAVSWRPWFAMPPSLPSEATFARRVAAGMMVLLPWSAAYSLFSLLPPPADAVNLRMAWESAIPPIPSAAWMMWVYSAAYPAVIAAPLLLRTDQQLHRFVVAAWLATFTGFAIMLLFPGIAAFFPLHLDGGTAWLAVANRTLDADWLALPSFHAVWIVLAAYCFATRIPRLAPLWVGLAGLVCISCIATGSHAVFDVISGMALALACWHHEKCWRFLLGRAERLGNSWSAVQVGPIRIISHATWSAAAAIAGLLAVLRVTGPNLIVDIAMVFGAGLIAAGAWGYCLEGGGRLSRPFGYYGFLFGATSMLGVLALSDQQSAHILVAAFAIGAPLAQAVGRLRCVVQGCCHGKPVNGAIGMCIVHPQSRVTTMGGLHGIPIHPTQLYSIAGNVLIFLFLQRMWEIGTTSSFLGGMYLVLSSLARFAEEQYRGEPQTLNKHGLAVYQWIAIALFGFGILFSMTGGVQLAPAWPLTMAGMGMSVAGGIVAAILMSVDFPASRRRFSRLTVTNEPCE